MKTLVRSLSALVFICGLVTSGFSQETVSHDVFWELQLEDKEVSTLTDREIDRLAEESARHLLKSSLSLVKKINALGENKGVTIIGTSSGHTLVTPKGTLQLVPKVISRIKGDIQAAGKDDLVALLNPGLVLDAPGIPLTWIKTFSGSAPRGEVLADKLTSEASEPFIITVLPDNRLSIRAHTGYLMPAKSGAGNVAANSTLQHANWELETHADATVSLKRPGIDGKYWYLSVDADVQRAGTPPVLRADKDKVTNAEKFTLEFKDGFVRIKSVSADRYLSVLE